MNPTVKIDHYKNLAKQVDSSGRSYKGLQILANRGVHEYVANALGKLLPAGAHVLELGAGTGALSLRLADLGFQVTSVDYVAENYKAQHSRITFRQADLNREWAAEDPTRYDAVIGTEIIEHIENTRHFVRMAVVVLKPGGLLMITTPNINSPKSLITYITTGRFDLFLSRHYTKDGHINPVPWFVLKDALIEAGMEKVRVFSFKAGAFSLKGFIGWLMLALAFGNPAPKGKKLVALANKPV